MLVCECGKGQTDASPTLGVTEIHKIDTLYSRRRPEPFRETPTVIFLGSRRKIVMKKGCDLSVILVYESPSLLAHLPGEETHHGMKSAPSQCASEL